MRAERAPAQPPAKRMRRISVLERVRGEEEGIGAGVSGCDCGCDAGAGEGEGEGEEEAVEAAKDSRVEAGGGCAVAEAAWNGSSPLSILRKTKSARAGRQQHRHRSQRTAKDGGLTTPEEDPTRDPIMHGGHQSTDIEPSQSLLARNLRRNAERAEFLAWDGLDLSAGLDDFDLRDVR